MMVVSGKGSGSKHNIKEEEKDLHCHHFSCCKPCRIRDLLAEDQGFVDRRLLQFVVLVVVVS